MCVCVYIYIYIYIYTHTCITQRVSILYLWSIRSTLINTVQKFANDLKETTITVIINDATARNQNMINEASSCISLKHSKKLVSVK